MIQINGKTSPDAAGLTLSAYLTQTGYDAARVAVERGGQIIPHARYGETVLADGDTIEIVHFVGGG